MRYDFSDDPYYQTAKQEKAEADARQEQYEAWLEARSEEALSECDCCGKMKAGCEDVITMGMDTHACPQCCGDGLENY